jgi:hypothetical protein
LKLSHYPLPRFRRSFLSLQTNFDIVYPIHEKAEDAAHPSDSKANLEKIPAGLLEVGDTVRVPQGATPRQTELLSLQILQILMMFT